MKPDDPWGEGGRIYTGSIHFTGSPHQRLPDAEDLDRIPSTEEDDMARHSWRTGHWYLFIGIVLLSIAVVTFGAILAVFVGGLACLIYATSLAALAGFSCLIAADARL